MRRIGLMVIKRIIFLPTWFFKIWRMGRSTDTHTEQERYHYLQKVVNKANKAGRVEVESYGIENIPTEDGFIMFPNHQGMFDMLAIISKCPKPFGVVVKKEAANVILVKQVLELLRGISLDRSDLKASLQMINQICEEVKKGRNYIIFAEGTRSKNGNQILDFKGGSFKCAVKAKCPIVPVALIDSFKPFDISSIKKEKVQVHYLEPIYPEQYIGLKTTEIAHLVHDKIQLKINENIG